MKLFICCINNLKMFQVSIWLERNKADDPAAGKAEERRYTVVSEFSSSVAEMQLVFLQSLGSTMLQFQPILHNYCLFNKSVFSVCLWAPACNHPFRKKDWERDLPQWRQLVRPP